MTRYEKLIIQIIKKKDLKKKRWKSVKSDKIKESMISTDGNKLTEYFGDFTF